MTKIKLNSCLFLLLLLLFSCAQRSEEKAAMATEQDSISLSKKGMNEIENNFYSDSLTDEQKELFSQRAIQKLNDYYNYIDIISNKAYEITLRNHAKVVVEELFINKEKIHSFVDSVGFDTINPIKIAIINAYVLSSPKPIDDSTFAGKILFEKQFIGNKKQSDSIRFLIRKTNKNFGEEKKLVWETYLDEYKK